jgi:hypothetical protein
VITPCTWSPGRQLLAQQAEATWEMVMASRALTPSQGAAEAWASPAGEVHVEVGHGQAGAGQALGRPRVDHHGGVDAVEGAPLEHEDLAAAALLGRRAQHPHL